MNTDAAADAEAIDADGPQPLLLRQQPRIIETLHRLRLHRDLLTVRPLGSNRASSSIVLAVDAVTGVDFDALHPAPQPTPTAGDLLVVRGSVDGCDLHFNCRVGGTVNLDGRPALRTALPDEIAVIERRAAHRVRLPLQGDLAKTFVRDDQGEHPLRLTDISHLGAGAQSQAGIPVRAGDLLQLRISLPGATLDTRAEVRAVRPLGGAMRMGLRFADLGRESRQLLVQAIHRIERQLIRYARGQR